MLKKSTEPCTMLVLWLAAAMLLGYPASLVLAQADPAAPRFPAASAEVAWKLLPQKAKATGRPPLPAWARVLVQSLPRATGAMLDLDYLHRAGNPLGPVLSGQLRWVAANTSDCDYARRYAAADLRRAGRGDADLKQLGGDLHQLPEKDRNLVRFARKMTTAAATVTDEEVAELLRDFGAEKVVAMVHTLAHANFQNRLFLALGLEMEPGGPFPAVDFQLDPDQRATIPAPARPARGEQLLKPPGVKATLTRPTWRELDFSEVEKALERQQARQSRITLLSPAQLEHLRPEERGPATRIIWSNVSLGYQPKLTRAWFTCMQAFQQEAKLDRLFTGSLFWVITRSNECFY